MILKQSQARQAGRRAGPRLVVDDDDDQKKFPRPVCRVPIRIVVGICVMGSRGEEFRALLDRVLSNLRA